MASRTGCEPISPSRGSSSNRVASSANTTGNRLILDTRVVFAGDAILFDEDPRLGEVGSQPVREAMMGDILQTGEAEVTLHIDVTASAPIERIDIRNGLDTEEVYRPYPASDLGRRIRVIWEGSEYRGRGRETVWDGSAELDGNRFEQVAPINRYNLDKRFDLGPDTRLEWTALTTGGFGGFDALLSDPENGRIRIETALVQETIDVADIGYDEKIFANGGIDRRIRVYRLPDENPHDSVRIERRIRLRDDRDNALYVRITTEDGHFAWSSPIYLFR